MAPPSPRRPGFSRRAQYGIFASYVIAVFGAAFALLLVLTARFDPDGHSALQSLLADVTSPVSSAARGTLAGLGDLGDSVGAYIDAGAKYKAMARELEAARKKLIEADALRLENRHLKQLLGINPDDARPVAHAALRLKEASKLGFERALCPTGIDASGAGIKLQTFRTLGQFVDHILARG